MSEPKLVVGIASRSLFDLSDSHDVYLSEGIEAFAKYQIAREDKPLRPGRAFNLVRKLLMLNSADQHLVEVVLLSRNTADSGLRIFNSIKHYSLDITRAAFCGGGAPWAYAKAFRCDLFLSNNDYDVRQALEYGIAAATVVGDGAYEISNDTDINIAFDGDAVIFSDEAEQVFHKGGLEAFKQSEVEAAHRPLRRGPFFNVLNILHELRNSHAAEHLKLALVTARSAPAHERVIRTLRDWEISVDQSVFLGGLNKRGFLDAFNADIFFDDQHYNVDDLDFTIGGHVPSGIKNT